LKVARTSAGDKRKNKHNKSLNKGRVIREATSHHKQKKNPANKQTNKKSKTKSTTNTNQMLSQILSLCIYIHHRTTTTANTTTTTTTTATTTNDILYVKQV